MTSPADNSARPLADVLDNHLVSACEPSRWDDEAGTLEVFRLPSSPSDSIHRRTVGAYGDRRRRSSEHPIGTRARLGMRRSNQQIRPVAGAGTSRETGR